MRRVTMEGALLRKDYLASKKYNSKYQATAHIIDSHLALYELYEEQEAQLARLAEQCRALEAENAVHRDRVRVDKEAFELRTQP